MSALSVQWLNRYPSHGSPSALTHNGGCSSVAVGAGAGARVDSTEGLQGFAGVWGDRNALASNHVCLWPASQT